MTETNNIFDQPRQNLFAEAATVSEVLGQLGGYTSVCWDEDGVFQSERAKKAVEDAEERINEINKENS